MKLNPYIPEIRYIDIDSMGHVNNAVFLTYFEQARVHFFHQIMGTDWNWHKQGILVARNEIDYKRPVLFNDRIQINVNPIQIGNTSFTIGYSITALDNVSVVYASGKSVLVCIDHTKGLKQSVPVSWREAFASILAQ